MDQPPPIPPQPPQPPPIPPQRPDAGWSQLPATTPPGGADDYWNTTRANAPIAGVWPWFVVYCVAMAVIYLCVAGIGGIVLLLDPADMDMDRSEQIIIGTVYLGMGVAFMLPFAVAPMLPKRKWVWVFDIVIICLGLTSCCTLPACIPLLIYWLKPETKAMFGWV